MTDQRVALVTGGNRGIGFGCVQQLAEDGYQTILTCRRMADGNLALAKMGKLSEQVTVIALDVTDPDDVAAVRTEVERTFGRLDILINNAAINYDTWQQPLDANLKEVAQTLDTNLLGPWRVVQKLVPLMRKNGFGRIVNVSSGSGALVGMGKETPGYGVSKAALNALTIKLADELQGSGILVNSVCPGWVRTDMGGKSAPRSIDEGVKSVLWAAYLADDGPTGGFFRDGKRISF